MRWGRSSGTKQDLELQGWGLRAPPGSREAAEEHTSAPGRALSPSHPQHIHILLRRCLQRAAATRRPSGTPAPGSPAGTGWTGPPWCRPWRWEWRPARQCWTCALPREVRCFGFCLVAMRWPGTWAAERGPVGAVLHAALRTELPGLICAVSTCLAEHWRLPPAPAAGKSLVLAQLLFSGAGSTAAAEGMGAGGGGAAAAAAAESSSTWNSDSDSADSSSSSSRSSSLVCNEIDAGRRRRLVGVLKEYLPEEARAGIRWVGFVLAVQRERD